MKIVDPGHCYALTELDGDRYQVLIFVKREGEGYPGNKGHYPGVIMQEVLRAVCDRLDYVNGQIPCQDNRYAKECVQKAIWYLERRAASRHDREWNLGWEDIDKEPVCEGCGHIGCPGCERAHGLLQDDPSRGGERNHPGGQRDANQMVREADSESVGLSIS